MRWQREHFVKSSHFFSPELVPKGLSWAELVRGGWKEDLPTPSRYSFHFNVEITLDSQRHFQTGAPLPLKLFEKNMRAAVS